MPRAILLGLVIFLSSVLSHAQTSAAAPAAPVPTSPADGAVVPDFHPTVAWNLPPGATQFHVQITPINNDGPGIDLIRNAGGWYTLPDPTQWYGLLPDMTYNWHVQASDAPGSAGPNNPSWSPWSPVIRFRTPTLSSASITLVGPSNGELVQTFTPVLRWIEANPNAWYYEVQLSKDQTFTTDPAKATASVYWELRHGAVTVPPRSYTVPASFLLEEGRTYYWRVRPRVQGDGQPVAWSNAATFRTGTTSALAKLSSTMTEATSVGTTIGAAMVVAPGTVLPDATGAPGTVAFSIERTTGLTVTLPQQAVRQRATVSGFSYTFGPVGIPLERPVSIWLPVPAGTQPGQATIYRYDLASGSWVAAGGELDTSTNRVTASVFQLGAFVVAVVPPDVATANRASASGRFVLSNKAAPGSGTWLAACVESGSAQLRFLDVDGSWREGALAALAAPSGSPGWANQVGWAAPQGTYRVLLTRFTPQGSAWMPWTGNPIALNGTADSVIELDPTQGTWTPGRAPCAGISLATLGTGDVQVTLAWANPTDLDLAVVDASGDMVWFGNTTGRTGGTLDRDTNCGNFQLGRPENIYWPLGKAVKGRYRIIVTYYRDCGGTPAQVNLAVRIVLPSGARTVFTSIANRGDEREAAAFDVP